jgi:glycosyltransferase involved in cell wall biosynthesis
MNVSVVIPCHNAGRWIATALRSVVSQTRPPEEIVIVDDGSSDDSIAVIEATGIPVKLLHVNARNAAAARNAGIEAVCGDWVALLDADDVWYPNHLARAAELLDGTEDVAFMSSHDWIDLRGGILPVPDEFRCRLPAPRSRMGVDEFFQILDSGFHFGHSTVLYRRDHLLAVGMFDVSQRRRHDIDLWIRMIADRSWAYDTVKSAGYRLDTPGGLSTAEAECDYFNLRALVRNVDRADSESYRAHLARQARRAMGIAFIDGPDDHYAAIRSLAWPHLSARYRFFYWCAALCPRMAQEVILTKRRILRRRVTAA